MEEATCRKEPLRSGFNTSTNKPEISGIGSWNIQQVLEDNRVEEKRLSGFTNEHEVVDSSHYLPCATSPG
jgi:hypothetical protein